MYCTLSDKNFKKGDKVLVKKCIIDLDLGEHQKEAEEKALNRCKNRPATVLYWVYDDGSEIMPSADTYSELIKKVNSWGNGIYYMKIQYDDNQEVDSKYSYELEKIS